MCWVHKHLKTISGILVLTVMCGLFFSVTFPAQGFIVFMFVKERGILLHSIDKPQWRIGYNFTADCPAAFRQQEEELKVLIVKALQTWLQPLRARYPHRRFTDDFRLVRQPDVEKCGDDWLLLDELDARITFDCKGKEFPFAMIADRGTAPEVCMKEGGTGIDHRSFIFALVHELGHAFGLVDTYVRGQLVSSGGLAHTIGKQPAAVMSGDFRMPSPLQLGEDDKNGIIWLYKYLHENHPGGDCFFADYVPDEQRKGGKGRCRPKYPLIFEAKHSLPITVKLILHDDPTLELNARDHTGMTALHYAVQRADTEMVKVLLAQANIKVNIPNAGGHTPAQLARHLRHFRLAVMIEKHPTARLSKGLPWTVERAWTLTTTWGALKRAR